MTDDRHHHVQLQLASLGTVRNGRITTNDVKHGHVQHFCHHRIHFSRHYAGPGLNGREMDFVQTSRWSRGEESEIIRDASERDRKRAKRCGEIHHVGHRLHALEKIIR